MSSFAWAANGKSKLDMSRLVLPSELAQMPKTPGAVYYNQAVKGKVLIPVHIWGEVKQSGLHFVPADTSFVGGLSMAGGPNTRSDMESVRLMRANGQGIQTSEFNLTEGGDLEVHDLKLKAGDTIFVPKSTYYEDRAYYTSLISVAVSVLSGVLLYTTIKNN